MNPIFSWPSGSSSSLRVLMESDSSSSLCRIILPKDFPNLEDQIECPVCLDFLIGRTRMCTRGHSICQKCQAVMTTCPLCRKEMSQVRNYFLEYFMDNCTLRCKYTDQGCTDVLKSKDYYKHTDNCHFREVSCSSVTFDACKYISSFLDFIPHLQSRHKILTFANGKEYCFYFPREKGTIFQTPYACIEFDGKMFFYNFATYPVNSDNGKSVTISLWWVSVFNPTLDSTKYRCRIKICSWRDENLIMTWSGPVLDFRVTAEKVLLENQCLSSTLPGLKQYCSDDGINPSFVFSHVESAEIFKVEETEKQTNENGERVTVLQPQAESSLAEKQFFH